MFIRPTVTAKQASKPYVASLAPEAAKHNESLKANVLRTLVQMGFLGVAGGTGTALLTHYLGRHSVKMPESDNPDVDLPYPVKKASLPPWVHLGAVPAVSAAIQGAAGAVGTPDSPIAGGSYGAARGLLQGLGTGAGTYLGHRYLAPRLGGGPNPNLLIQLLSSLAGAGAGYSLGNVASGAGLKAVAGEPPWKKKPQEKKSDWADSLVHKFLPTPANEPPPAILSPSWFRGDSHTSETSIPWAIPGGIAAGVGGLYGANQLVRWLLHKKRKHELNNELATAQREYDEAMQDQYDPDRIQSLSEKKSSQVDDRLDQLFDGWQAMKKNANLNNILGHGAGAYLLLAGLLGGGAGMGTYRYLQGRSQAKLLEKALKHRAMIHSLSNPPDVYLNPVPVERHEDKKDSDRDKDSN